MKTHRSLFVRIVFCALALTLAGLTRAQTFTPMPLTPSSFTQCIVVPTNWLYHLNAQSVSVSVDHGPGLTTVGVPAGFPTYWALSNGDTYIEVGLDRSNINWGLPYRKSLLTNTTFSSHVYQLGDWSIWNSNCLCIGPYTNGATYLGQPLVGGPYTYPTNNPYTNANLTLNNAGGGFNTNIYTALSLLVGGGAGGGTNGATNTITVQYADGTTQTLTDVIPNWFVNSATISYGTANPTVSFAYTASARGEVGENGNNMNQNPGVTSGSRLWSIDFALINTNSAVTNLTFTPNWTFGYNGSADMIFGVSGSTNTSDNTGGNTPPSTSVLTGPFKPIVVSGFNAGCVIPNASNTLAGLAPLTATMDNGTTLTSGGNTWFEVGWDQSAPTNGFPAHGSTITSIANPTFTYQMAASYQQNMATLIDTNHQLVNITPQTPTSLTAVSLLTAGASIGSGKRMTNLIILQHSDGVQETNVFIGYDWFETSQAPAYSAWERVNLESTANTSLIGREVNNLDTTGSSLGVPHLFDSEFQTYDGSPVTNIQCRYYLAGGTTWTTYILAVSYSTQSLPVGAVSSYTPAQNVFAGQTATFSVSHGLGSGLNYQWQYTDGETFTNNFSDGPSTVYGSSATISGSLTPTLNIANVGPYDLSISNASGTNIYYQCLLTNNLPSSTNSPMAVLSLRSATGTNILMPGDILADYYSSAPPNETLGEAAATPAGLQIPEVEDGTLEAYLNYGATVGQSNAFTGPVGFMVSPQTGATVVNALRFYVAVNASICDPADFSLEGSNDGGNTWTPIVLDTPLSLPNQRNLATSLAVNVTNQIMQEVQFANSTPYTTYALTIQNVKGVVQGSPITPNSMQIAEIQFIGSQVVGVAPNIVVQPTPTNKTIFAGGHLTTTSLEAAGVGPFSYQWYQVNGGTTNGVPNATNTSLSVTGIPAGNYTFFCVVSNSYGAIASRNLYLTAVAPAPLYEATVMADGPMAYWRLDEGNGSPATQALLSTPGAPNGGNGYLVAHDWAGELDGLYTNSYVGELGYSSNDVDTAAGFGVALTGYPANSFVGYVPGFSNFVTPTNHSAGFSVEAWVFANQAQSVGGAGIVTYGYGGGGEQFALDCGSTSNAYRFYFRDATGGTNVAGNPSHVAGAPVSLANEGADGRWHHLVGVLNSVNAATNYNALYVDGFLVASNYLGTNLLGVQSGTAPGLTIGARSSNSISTSLLFQFNGSIDEVAVYPTAFTPAKVLNHYYAAGIAPYFFVQPTNETVGQGAAVTISTVVRGTPNLGLQWLQVLPNGTTNTLVNGPSAYGTFSGVQTTNLVLSDAQFDPNGMDQYVLMATNAYGTNYSYQMTLTVQFGPPVFVQNLSSAYEFLAGFPFQLEASVDGTLPFSYFWYYNGAPLANSARISGVNSNVLTILNAQLSDAGTYQLYVTNSYSGASTPTGGTPSQAAQITILPVLGFNGAGGGWAVNANGSFNYGYVSSNVLQLTDGNGNEDASSFFSYPVYVGAWQASWTYQVVSPPATPADGTCFVIQNDPRGAAALGGGGGSLGVSGITPSTELEFNIYPGNPYNGVGFAFSTNGLLQDVTDPYPINLIGGDPIAVSLTYLNGQVTMILSDPGPASPGNYTNSFPFNLTSTLHTNEAYVGFTGADGGSAAVQQVSNFNFVSLPTLSVSSGSTPGTITISWPAGIGGYVLQQSAGLTPASWSNVGASPVSVGNMVQVTVPASITATFYRLHLQYTPQ